MLRDTHLVAILVIATLVFSSLMPIKGQDENKKEYIAYVSTENCSFDQTVVCPSNLVLFSPETRNEDIVPVNSIKPEGISWSPNYQQLAFLDNNFRYNLLDIESLSITPLRSSDDVGEWHSRIAWSPDGSHIALVGGETGGIDHHLFILDADGEQPTAVAEDKVVTMFSWSPDNARIAFTALEPEAQNDIYILDVNSNEITQLTEDNHSYNPDWSSNGDKIVYVSRQGEDRYLYVMDITTGDAELVSRSGGDVPFWVLNDTHILYSISSGFRRSDFVLLNLDTGTENRLISVETLSGYDVSPDKTRVAFIAVENNAAKLCVLNLNSADIQCAITPAFAAGRPAWGY